MTNNLQKKLFENGYLIIKNVLNFRRDLKPVLDDMDFVMDCLIQKYAKKKDVKKVLNLDFLDCLINEICPLCNPPIVGTNDVPLVFKISF